MANLRLDISSPIKKAVAVAACLAMLAVGWFSIRWHFANAVGHKLNPRQQESRLVLDWLIDQAPDDPQIRTSAGRVLETTFDMADATRSITEYERAAALSPGNYLVWLDLARARSANGDIDIARAAYENALRLAPNYSSVNWAFGNFLVRNGDTVRGVDLISKAANSDPTFASASVSVLYMIFDGDAGRIAAALGDGELVTASMARGLASLGAYRDAVNAWMLLDDNARLVTYSEDGVKLLERLVADHQYRFATAVVASRTIEGVDPPEVEKITNGGFESAIKLRDAGLFEWKIADGDQPQIGLGEGQKHNGRYSLWLTFNTFETTGFREISQTVAVLPTVAYELELFYRSEVKSEARLRWEILDPALPAVIATTEPLEAKPEWTRVVLKFTAPARTDGVTIRFIREGCIGPACPTNGRIMFDDISIRQADRLK